MTEILICDWTVYIRITRSFFTILKNKIRSGVKYGMESQNFRKMKYLSNEELSIPIKPPCGRNFNAIAKSSSGSRMQQFVKNYKKPFTLLWIIFCQLFVNHVKTFHTDRCYSCHLISAHILLMMIKFSNNWLKPINHTVKYEIKSPPLYLGNKTIRGQVTRQK